MRFCVLDFETRSEADLKAVGAYEYAVHPTTEIICAAWRIGTRESIERAPISAWSPFIWLDGVAENRKLAELAAVMADPSVRMVAHNAFFEQVITRFVLPKYLKRPLPDLPPARWQCTAAQAAALAIPRNLEGACQAMGLPVQKDMVGRKLILKHCKPRKATKNNQDKWHELSPDLHRLIHYCATDIDAETGLLLSTPELTENERAVWLLDQEINWRGFCVDRPLVGKILGMIGEETRSLNEAISDLTGLFTAGQRDELLGWLKGRGLDLPDLRAKTVLDALAAGGLTPKTRRALEIRQDASKTSTAKYRAFLDRSESNGRIRDILVYHAASTGRWSGAGVQPQNFPRGTIKDTETAVALVDQGGLESARFFYGRPMETFSSCLRSMIVPTLGSEFVCADYNAIEARVLFWLADHTAGIRLWESGADLYREMAARIFGVPVEKVTDAQRWLGKTTILGCGYGMGPVKFFRACRDQGQAVTEELAKAAVKVYRSEHEPVVALWKNVERAACRAVIARNRTGRSESFVAGRCEWFADRDFLWCKLPSGRRLAFKNPSVRFEETPWGEPAPKLYHYGLNSVTRKWEESATYGGKLVENIDQAISRDIMAHAMLNVSGRGYAIVLSVHDELLAEQRPGRPLGEFENAMVDLPEWAQGCPVKASGWTGKRYRK
jgi:DNA polymerase